MVNSLILEVRVGERNGDRIIQTGCTELGQRDTQGSKNKGRETSRLHRRRRQRMYLHFVTPAQGIHDPKVTGNGV
jgi:hypothetical protein